MAATQSLHARLSLRLCRYTTYVADLEWLRDQWDVLGRGKHNGFVKGVQYFTCPDGCGSFVRPDTVIQPSVSFQEAFIEKYSSDDAASAVGKMDFRAARQSKAAVVVELVGLDREVTRMQKTEEIEEVTLTACKVARAGNSDWLRDKACGVASLVLDDNLFKDWTSVAELATQLPNLHTLSLNGNRLQVTMGEYAVFSTALKKLRKLAINATGTDFVRLNRHVKYMPALTDLHMASNGISSIVDDDTSSDSANAVNFSAWPSLTLLDLSDNSLSSWADVLKLSSFAKLETLLLNGNRIPDISFPSQPVSANDTSPASNAISSAPFGALRVLALGNNKISHLSSVRALDALAALAEVRMQGNPVCECHGTNAFRQLVVAMLKNIKQLNGGEVRAREVRVGKGIRQGGRGARGLGREIFEGVAGVVMSVAGL